MTKKPTEPNLTTSLSPDQKDRIRAASLSMFDALIRVIPYMEAVEEELLVGHEACHWPVEFVRHAIEEATGLPYRQVLEEWISGKGSLSPDEGHPVLPEA